MASTSSSLTSCPASITPFACLPSAVPRLTWSRRRSPVDTCGSPSAFERRTACVPLPAPGGPRRTTMRAISALPRPARAAESAAARALAAHEALVVAHHELRVQAVDEVHGHADDDQH